eukprot:1186137-Prorocentrum_minimum.AAC.2
MVWDLAFNRRGCRAETPKTGPPGSLRIRANASASLPLQAMHSSSVSTARTSSEKHRQLMAAVVIAGAT